MSRTGRINAHFRPGSAPGIQVEFECSIDGCEAGERTDLVLTRVDDGTDRSFYATYDGRGEITIGPVTVEPGSTYEVSLFVFGCTAVPETFSIVVSP